MELRQVEQLRPEIVDKNHYVNFWEFSTNAIIIQCFDIPETWESLGYICKEIDIDERPDYADWVIAETALIRPHGKQLIVWAEASTPYRLKFRLLPYATDGRFEVYDFDYTVNEDTRQVLRIEAEDFANRNNYNNENKSFASNGKLVRLGGGNSGWIETAFLGQPGYYDVVVIYHDERDGIVDYELEIDNQIVQTWIANTSSGADNATEANRVTFIAARAAILNTGSSVRVRATRSQGTTGDNARIDYVEFLPV